MDSKRKSTKLRQVYNTDLRTSVELNELNLENDSETPATNVQLCRVCLNEGDIPIYGDESIGDISESLTTYGGIEIQIDDDFPKYICHDCHEQLQSAIKFRQTAQETDQFLRDSFLPVEESTDIKEHSDNDDEKELFKETLADVNTYYHCRACELDFESSREYGQHMFIEDHNNLKDKCPFCNREYSCIQKHLAMHKQSKTVLCKICGEKFLRPNFWRHRESHHDVLPYKCSICPYRGRYGGDFKVHMRKHTGERPYQCNDCSASFISKSNLNRHVLTHKSNHNFQCAECTKGFYSRQELDMHIKVSHEGVKEHLCNLCGKAYGSRKALMKHQLQVHKREKLRGGRIPVYLRLKSKHGEKINNDTLDNDITSEQYCEEL